MLSNRLMHRRLIRRGAIVVLVAVSLSVVLGFVAVSIDGGALMEQRRKAQATADAAALAAAEDLFKNYPTHKGVDTPGTAATRAKTIAAANGFGNDGKTSTVSVLFNPSVYTGGENKGQVIPKGYVEVTVQYNQPRYFSAMLGSGAIPVRARAVARGQWAPSAVGIHVLDLHSPAALRATGGGTATVTGGASVIVNSDASDAAETTGGAIITSARFDIVGGAVGGGFVGPIYTGIEPQPDPLRNIPGPKASDYPIQSMGPTHLSAGNRTLQPGVYRGGIAITGKANVTMLPGIYYMDGGGFSFTGQGNLVAKGVMIYNDPKNPSDVIKITGNDNGAVTMTPPASGLYKGMTLFQNRTATHDMTVSGNGKFLVTGTFYTAAAKLNVTGGGAASIGSQYVSRYLDVNGSGGLTIDYNPDQAIPRRVLNLVE